MFYHQSLCRIFRDAKLDIIVQSWVWLQALSQMQPNAQCITRATLVCWKSTELSTSDLNDLTTLDRVSWWTSMLQCSAFYPSSPIFFLKLLDTAFMCQKQAYNARVNFCLQIQALQSSLSARHLLLRHLKSLRGPLANT